MNLAQELVANRKTIAEANNAEKRSYGVKVEAAVGDLKVKKNLRTREVPQELARKSPELPGLGKVSRRKTDNPLVKELLANGEVIGEAVDTRKEKRCWTITINGKTIECHTISKGIRQYGAQS
jgi:hypothetical protein